MSEIQIVGPKGSEATRFKKFFDDDIQIEPNSKIYLNHAILSKNEGVTFKEQQTFGFVITQGDIYGDLIAEPKISFNIPEGDYTYEQLKDTLVESIEEEILENNDNQDTFSAYQVLDQEGEGDKPFIGIKLKVNNVESDATEFGDLPINTNMVHDGGFKISQSTATTAEISSFAMHSSAYTHNTIYTRDPSKGFPEPDNSCVFFLFDGEDPLTIDAIESASNTNPPKITMGFYGKEYSEDDTVGTGTRTSEAGGITLVESTHQATDKAPTMFFQAVVEQRDEGLGDLVYLSIYVARSTTQGTIKEWVDQKEEINNLDLIHRVELSSLEFIDKHQQLRFELFSFQDTLDGDFSQEFKTYFGVNFRHNNQVYGLFDSSVTRNYADLRFFTGLGTGSDVIKRSQRAYHPCFGTNIQNYGYQIAYSGVISNDGILLRQTNYFATEELGKAMGVFSPDNEDNDTNGIYVSDFIFPQPATKNQINTTTAIPATFEDFYRMDSYVIKINNLPIQSFKTNEIKGNRGYKQSVLATIPTPFQNSSEESRVNIDGQDYLSVTYNAYYPLMKAMKNQALVVNHFDFEIVRLSDDKEATDLDQVAINFTIQPPE